MHRLKHEYNVINHGCLQVRCPIKPNYIVYLLHELHLVLSNAISRLFRCIQFTYRAKWRHCCRWCLANMKRKVTWPKTNGEWSTGLRIWRNLCSHSGFTLVIAKSSRAFFMIMENPKIATTPETELMFTKSLFIVEIVPGINMKRVSRS